jgi:hypothetical protein
MEWVIRSTQFTETSCVISKRKYWYPQEIIYCNSVIWFNRFSSRVKMIPPPLRISCHITVTSLLFTLFSISSSSKGWSSIPSRIKNSLFSTLSRPVLRPTQPPIQWVLGALSPGVKRPVRQSDHSPLTSAEVKNTWIYTSTPLIRLHGVVLN